MASHPKCDSYLCFVAELNAHRRSRYGFDLSAQPSKSFCWPSLYNMFRIEAHRRSQYGFNLSTHPSKSFSWPLLCFPFRMKLTYGQTHIHPHCQPHPQSALCRICGHACCGIGHDDLSLHHPCHPHPHPRFFSQASEDWRVRASFSP